MGFIFPYLILFQELENTFDGWTGDLAHLTVLRESLSCYISAEDLSVLQERIELLHRQWDEICHQVQQSAPAVTEIYIFSIVLCAVCGALIACSSSRYQLVELLS